MGAIVNFVGIPFALPYFAALDQILKANLAIFEYTYLGDSIWGAGLVIDATYFFLTGKGLY